MAQLIEIQRLVNNADFQARVRIAAFKLAVDILNDPARASEHNYFHRIQNQPDDKNWLMPLVYQTALNATVQDNNGGTDADIDFVIRGFITDFSVPEIAI